MLHFAKGDSKVQKHYELTHVTKEVEIGSKPTVFSCLKNQFMRSSAIDSESPVCFVGHQCV